MSKLTDKINSIPNLLSTGGCTNEQISEAEKKLNLTFPEDFIEYTKNYGVISFFGTELTGLNVDGYLNVVDATLQEQKNNNNFPENCFVLENLYIDGILAVSDESGKVYSLQYDKKELLCNSFSEYLDLCIKRKN